MLSELMPHDKLLTRRSSVSRASLWTGKPEPRYEPKDWMDELSSQHRTFRVLSQGVSKISFEYSRPWEDGEKAEWTFVLSVVAE